MAVTFPKRFDEEEAKKGVWFDVYDEFDQYYGSYLCRHQNKHSAVYKMLVERYQRVHRKELSGGQISNEALDAHFLVHTILMDWKLKDDKGKDIPFSPAKAFEVLSQEDAAYVVEFLFSCSKNVSHYRNADDAEAVQEEVAKN